MFGRDSKTGRGVMKRSVMVENKGFGHATIGNYWHGKLEGLKSSGVSYVIGLGSTSDFFWLLPS